MRAWALRRLGPGSTIKEFSGLGSTPDRYGDIQLEANVEYRFPLGSPFGIKVNGAVFTDVGNVWLMKKSAGAPEEIFKLSRLGKDIAVGAGAGLRVDLNFFVIRFDYSYKVKDPSPAPADAAGLARAAELPRLETVRLLKRLKALDVHAPAVLVNAVGRGRCRRCAAESRAERREMRTLARSISRRRIVVTPAQLPPPAGPASLRAWAGGWRGTPGYHQDR